MTKQDNMKTKKHKLVTRQLDAELKRLRDDLKGKQSRFADMYLADRAKVSRVLSGKVFDAKMLDELIQFRKYEQEREQELLDKLTQKLKK